MLLNMTDVSKSYIDKLILDNINLIVEDRDKIGLIGNNGSGKTTLFHIITEEISKDSGTIFMPKNLRIGHLEQQLNYESDKNLYDECEEIFSHIIQLEKEIRALEQKIADSENPNFEEDMIRYGTLQEKFTELDGYSYPSKIRGTLIGLGFELSDFEKKVNTLSGGQKSRLALAKLLLTDADLMLLDEPTNHLDISAIAWLEKYIQNFKGAMIIISHDRYFLNNVVNKIALIEHRKLSLYKGNYTNYMKLRKADIEIRKRQYENQQKEIKRQEQIIERFLGLGRDRFIKQGKSRQKLLEKMKKLDPPSETKRTSISFEPKFESAKEVLKVENLSKSFGERQIFKNIDFIIYKQDKVGIIGPNGVGKSTLFKIITNKLHQNSGKCEFGARVTASYFDQEMESLTLDNTVIDEIWDEYPNLTHYEIRSYLAKFLFIGDDVFKIIEDLSGGERGRVALLKIMLKGANLLLLDEPTNHLDIDSKEVLEDALKLYTGTVVSISHDRYFLNSTCNRIIEMTESGVNEFLGNYDYYLEKTTSTDEPEEEYITKTEINNQKKLAKQERQLLKEKNKAKKELENKIHQLESSIKEIDNLLSSKEIYENIEKVHELSNSREEQQNKLENLYEEWFLIEEGMS